MLNNSSNSARRQGNLGLPVHLPLDHLHDFPRVGESSFLRGTLSVRLEPELWAGLTDFAASERVDPVAVLVTGFGVFLARHTGQENLAVSCLFARRGPSAVRFATSENPPLRAVLKDVAEQLSRLSGQTPDKP